MVQGDSIDDFLGFLGELEESKANIENVSDRIEAWNRFSNLEAAELRGALNEILW